MLLLEAGPRILNAFPESLAAYATRKLARLGVTVRTNSPVESITAHSDRRRRRGDRHGAYDLGRRRAAPRRSARMLGVALDRAGRVAVNGDLSVAGLDDVYALGDIAVALDADGKPLPGLAQVAKQEGVYLGRALARNIRAARRPGPSSSTTAATPRSSAATPRCSISAGRRCAAGSPGCFWALIHVYLLVGFEHRLLVAIQWLWRYVTYERGSRLIAEQETDGWSA